MSQFGMVSRTTIILASCALFVAMASYVVAVYGQDWVVMGLTAVGLAFCLSQVWPRQQDRHHELLDEIGLVAREAANGRFDLRVYCPGGHTQVCEIARSLNAVLDQCELFAQQVAVAMDRAPWKARVDDAGSGVLRGRFAAEVVNLRKSVDDVYQYRINDTKRELSGHLAQLNAANVLRDLEQNQGDLVEAHQFLERAHDKLTQLADRTGQSGQHLHDVGRRLLEIEDIGRRQSSVVTGLILRLEEVAKIIQVLSDIGEQSKLLALNALIEAARSGDSGIAMIAEEVQELAHNTKRATTNLIPTMEKVLTELDTTLKELNDVRRISEESVAVVSFTRSTVGEFEDAVHLAAHQVRRGRDTCFAVLVKLDHLVLKQSAYCCLDTSLTMTTSSNGAESARLPMDMPGEQIDQPRFASQPTYTKLEAPYDRVQNVVDRMLDCLRSGKWVEDPDTKARLLNHFHDMENASDAVMECVDLILSEQREAVEG